jgi:oligopeptide/dipeptide ABC transporter ATP-binding protein
MSDELLRVRDLRVVIERPGAEPVPAVDGVSLDAAPGEVVGIVGESGSGKSLTLRAVTGLLPAGVRVDGGEVAFQGRDLLRLGEAEMRGVRGGGIGMVFQEPMTALNPTMRVGDQIAEGARAHLGLDRRAAARRAAELLDRVGIQDTAARTRLYPHQLSGGMRQRVMIAIALAASPALVLCDEPTTALDATVTSQVLDLLGELARDLGVGMVLVTHDLGVIARACSRVLVMYAGRVVEEGPTAEVVRRPRHPYTLALLRAVPTRSTTIDDLVPIPGTPPEPGALAGGCPFAPRCPLVQPACTAGPPPSFDLGERRRSACLRHELLAVGEERVSANG